jgi:hypothetical protein
MMSTFFSGCCYRRFIFFGALGRALLSATSFVRGGQSAPSFYALDIQVGYEKEKRNKTSDRFVSFERHHKN